MSSSAFSPGAPLSVFDGGGERVSGRKRESLEMSSGTSPRRSRGARSVDTTQQMEEGAEGVPPEQRQQSPNASLESPGEPAGGTFSCHSTGPPQPSRAAGKNQVHKGFSEPEALNDAGLPGAVLFVNNSLCRMLARQTLLHQPAQHTGPGDRFFQRVGEHASDALAAEHESHSHRLPDEVPPLPTNQPPGTVVQVDQRRAEVERVRDLEEEEHRRRLEEVERANESVQPCLTRAPSKDTKVCRGRPRGLQAILARPKYRRMQVDVAADCFQEFRQENTRNIRLSYILFSPKFTAIFCGLWGLAILSLGIVILVISQKCRSVDLEYSSQAGSSVKKSIVLKEQLDAPVFVYYKIQNFFGNAKQYLRDGPQHITSNQRCTKIRTQREALDMRTINARQTLAWLESDIFSGAPIPEDQGRTYPCGLQSASIFNDEFTLHDEEGDVISISDRDAIPGWNILSYMDLRGELEGILPWMVTGSSRYRVWSEASFTPEFLKLYGIIASSLKPGVYSLSFSETSWPAEAWEARKGVVLMSLSGIGSSNVLLAWIIIGTGVLCVILSVFVVICVFLKLQFPGSTVRQARLDKVSLAEGVALDPALGEGLMKAALPQPQQSMKLNEILEGIRSDAACLCPLHSKKESRNSRHPQSRQSTSENESGVGHTSRKNHASRQGEASSDSRSTRKGIRDGCARGAHPDANPNGSGTHLERNQLADELSLSSPDGYFQEPADQFEKSETGFPAFYVSGDPTELEAGGAGETISCQGGSPRDAPELYDQASVEEAGRYLAVPSTDSLPHSGGLGVPMLSGRLKTSSSDLTPTTRAG